jgi:RNA polymerase sigma-70 factor (ECF subfamily)
MDGATLQSVTSSPSSSPRPEFASIYTAELRWVWRTLWRLGVRERDLEDVAHDVFVVVHRKLEDFDPSRPLRPWLFGICFRTALDRRRKSSHKNEIPTEPTALPEQGNVADAAVVDVTALIERKESKALVQLALASLPLEQRAVFVLHELEGTSIPECVAVLEAPLNTLYSRLRLARAAFTKFIQRAQQRAQP